METGLSLSQSYSGFLSTGSLEGTWHSFLQELVQPDVLEVSRTHLSEPWVYAYHTRSRDDTTPLTLSDLNLVRLQHLAQCVYLQSRLDDWQHRRNGHDPKTHHLLQ